MTNPLGVMTTIRIHRSFLFLALLIGGVLVLSGAGAAHAQSGMRSVGAVATGGGTSALDTGPAALYSNPANLTVGPHTHTAEVQLLRIGAYIGGDLVQFNHIKPFYFRDEEKPPLSIDRQNSILDEWFGSGMRRIDTYVEVMPFSLTYRPKEASWAAGIGLRGRMFQASAINRGIIEMAQLNLGGDRTFPVDARSRLYSTIDVTGSFSYRFSSLPLSVGASPRVIFGAGYADFTLDSKVKAKGDSLVHRFDYTARAAGPPSSGLYDTFDPLGSEPLQEVVGGSTGIAGTGFGIDLGATYTIRPKMHVSASITDLGLINWSKDAQTATPTNNAFRFTGAKLNLERLDKEYGGDKNAYIKDQVDSLATEAYGEAERDRSPFTTGLPTTLHVSGTWDSPVGFGPALEIASLNGGVSVGLNKDAGAVPDPAAVHMGATINLGPIPLRTGVRFWGTQAVTFSGGLGLNFGFYRIDLGASVTPKTSTLGSGGRYAVTLSLATIRL